MKSGQRREQTTLQGLSSSRPLDRRQTGGTASALLQALLALPFFLPAFRRLLQADPLELSGLLSDLAIGLIVFSLARQIRRLPRLALLLPWTVFQVAALELYEAMRRLPGWQDLFYLADPAFVKNSITGFHFVSPVYAGVIIFSALLAATIPRRKPAGRSVWSALTTALLLLCAHGLMSLSADTTDVAARYNPLHWLVADAVSRTLPGSLPAADPKDLPANLTLLDLQGRPLLDEGGKGRAKNVLIITLEGISGIYLPDIRTSMKVPEPVLQMHGLARETADAMLVADFVAHSHQTIRGLYAIHCGDFSKFSYATPKAFEIQENPARAGQCLPAQLAANGWQTHYLQGAPLQFMNKDRVMPAIGFEETHGLEWFPERPADAFIWGTTDEEFFHGARDYITHLQEGDKPWLLSLLTVATHQPYAASEALVDKHGSRKIAAVAQLDEAVAGFLQGLRRDGILDNTLVLITSDESHGSAGADWYGSWGLAAIMAPEKKLLPRMKKGTYGLVDIEASILDYLGLSFPPAIIGRSMFREYATSRDMVSYTAGRLRWQTADNRLYECSRDGNCRISDNTGIIGLRPDSFSTSPEGQGARRFALAGLLDDTLLNDRMSEVLRFADGEIRELPQQITNEWTDNLIGAQYLGFPKNSRVDVDIQIKALTVQESGIQLNLILRQFEEKVESITFPEFPLLYSGDECRLTFSFNNAEARQAFSFHLLGKGDNSSVQLNKFEISVTR